MKKKQLCEYIAEWVLIQKLRENNVLFQIFFIMLFSPKTFIDLQSVQDHRLMKCRYDLSIHASSLEYFLLSATWISCFYPRIAAVDGGMDLGVSHVRPTHEFVSLMIQFV